MSRDLFPAVHRQSVSKVSIFSPLFLTLVALLKKRASNRRRDHSLGINRKTGFFFFCLKCGSLYRFHMAATGRGLFAWVPVRSDGDVWMAAPERPVPSDSLRPQKKAMCRFLSVAHEEYYYYTLVTSLTFFFFFFYDTHSKKAPFDILSRVEWCATTKRGEEEEDEDRNIFTASMFRDNKAQQLLVFKRSTLSLPLGFRPEYIIDITTFHIY